MLTADDITIASMSLEGRTKIDIARSIKRNVKTVAAHLEKEEVRDLIEAAQAKLVRESLAVSADNINTVINNYLWTDDPQLKDHGFKASLKMLESVGILPSNNQSVVINNFQQNNLISPFMKELITRHFSLPAPKLDETVVDAEEVK